jgi:Tol biopolymer transport system component
MYAPLPKAFRGVAAVAPTTLVVVLFGLTGCAHKPGAGQLLPDEEPALGELQQLTFGGENAEAYWSFDGSSLSLQARHEDAGEGCDRIYRMQVFPQPAAPVRISSGEGSTTCAHFFPDGDLLYASTHLGGASCPPKPDMSQGYVWALTESYDIFRVKGDGSGRRRLTETPGYDAEGTVCARDGSIIFTSVRDGDLELYRMDGDGKNVRRLTNSVGYDGGAFFNHDCSRIVWRASRPRPGKEESDYKALLTKNLVRPSKLEIWVANADGTDARQLTDLDAASFAPAFHPTEDVIIFSSNVGDPRGREFDLWAMHGNGTGLRRITHAPGFDGFPHFSPDGKWLAFSSNRATAAGKHDTNVFLARWKGLGPLDEAAWRPADRIQRDIAWLAAEDRQGRGIGTEGLAAAGHYLEQRLRTLGAQPAGDSGGFKQTFPVITAVSVKPGSSVTIAGQPLGATDFAPLGFSAEADVTALMVLAGYGIVSPAHKIDDYAGVDAKGKIVLVRRFAPEDDRIASPAERRQLGDLRHKAWLARERGALGLAIVDWPLPPPAAPPDWQPAAEAALVQPSVTGAGDAGIPVIMVKRASVAKIMPLLLAKRPVTAKLTIGLVPTVDKAFNVVGLFLAAKQPAAGAIILGAHYDHLGLGGRFSLEPNSRKAHVGADDNASGTATVLEIARQIAERKGDLRHDVVVAFFSGEETGLLGSAHYARSQAALLKRTRAMINLDMVGRLRESKLDVLGAESATEWPALVRAACSDLRIVCNLSGDGQGPSDQASFYAAGLPVLHFFTGSHTDYHKPSDTADRTYPQGAATVADLSLRVLRALDAGIALSYQKGKSAPPGAGDARSFHASLGTIPDYAGPPGGKPGVLLAGVRAGGGADKAGMRRGDVLVRLGEHDIRSVEDLMYALQAAKPGQTARARLVRDGKEIEVEATFQEARRSP